MLKKAENMLALCNMSPSLGGLMTPLAKQTFTSLDARLRSDRGVGKKGAWPERLFRKARCYPTLSDNGDNLPSSVPRASEIEGQPDPARGSEFPTRTLHASKTTELHPTKKARELGDLSLDKSSTANPKHDGSNLMEGRLQ